MQRTIKVCPVVQSILDEQMDRWEEQVYKYPQVLHTTVDGVSVEVDGNIDPTEAKLRLKKIIENIDSTTLYDEEILGIMIRESRAYFSGSISAQQAAKNIQSKSQLYVSEQYG